jgi:hypothetical protein
LCVITHFNSGRYCPFPIDKIQGKIIQLDFIWIETHEKKIYCWRYLPEM